MDLKVAVVTLCLCALAFHATEGGIVKCCVKTRQSVPKIKLMMVRRWQMQESGGPCDISALILHVAGRRKPICANPTVRKHLKQVRLEMMQLKLGKVHSN
ncbi:C-C motif chemokine 27a [Dunckerocampus dactyliophorus]|uniref:C-C motif chemokine 27a n=1 Tax=Dunckerocampus dactyliophorus TaxID=161453 RepID=UPI0024068CE6|nr:C-C motif chemokine 27a [Dunckerocampus dactyliophorus]